jgi:hypothetical protein
LKSKSLWGDPAYDGNRFDLIQGGWQVQKDVWFKNFKNFGYRFPEDILGQAIDKFRKEYDKKHLVSIYVYGARNVAPSDEAELYIDDGKAE